MFSEEKVFIQYVKETLQTTNARIVALKIFKINNLISEITFNSLNEGYNMDSLAISEHRITYSEDVCEVIKYWCTKMNNKSYKGRVDFLTLFDNRYTEEQITEICKACYDDTYNDRLFNHGISAKRMSRIRELVAEEREYENDEKTQEIFRRAYYTIGNPNYTEEQAEEAYNAGINKLLPYWIYPEVDAVSMRLVREAVLEGIDCRKLLAYKFMPQQFVVLINALKEDVDLLHYCDESYTSEQMNEILQGILQDLDVSVYNDVKYDWEQMRQIRVGLLDGIDITAVTTEDLSAYYMEVLRISMLNGEGIQFYGDSYEDPLDRRERGSMCSADDALEAKRLQQMSLF